MRSISNGTSNKKKPKRERLFYNLCACWLSKKHDLELFKADHRFHDPKRFDVDVVQIDALAINYVSGLAAAAEVKSINGDLAEALQEARKYQLYANWSYVALPKQKLVSLGYIAVLKEHGVGLLMYANDKVVEIVRATKMHIDKPQFNKLVESLDGR